MPVSAVQLDFGLTSATGVLPPISAIWRKKIFILRGLPENGGSEAPSRQAAKVWRGGLQDVLWLQVLPDPTKWRDNRRGNKTPRYPDFRHKKAKVALSWWLNDGCKPAWVEMQLGMRDVQVDGGIRRPSGSVSTPVERHVGRVGLNEGCLELEACRKLCDNGPVEEAVDSLDILVQQGCRLPNNFFYRVLKRCIAQKNLVLGRRVHALTIESGYEGDAFLATHLIGLYASRGMLAEAMRVFSKVNQPTAHNWASIILACARHGQPNQAIGLYGQMLESAVKPDNRIFVSVLTACASAGDLAAGKAVHAQIRASAVKPNIYVQNCLVDMYAKCGTLEVARRVFNGLPRKDVVTWNALIAGYAQQGKGEAALTLYRCMQQEGLTSPDLVTFVCLLQACASIAALDQGKQLHAEIEERGLQADVVVGNSLVNMYAKCGRLDSAQRVFDGLLQKDVVTWNAMITGYARQGMVQEALSLYTEMQQEGLTPPDSVTFVSLLQACASVAALPLGKQLHAEIEERGLQDDPVVGASLVNMYAKCGTLDDAQRVFEGLSGKDVVTWNAMIAGYTQQGLGQEALGLYSSMEQEGITSPNSVTFICLLQACASEATLPLGKQVHALIEEQGLQTDVAVGSSLVNMYAKCGSLEDARQVFDSLPRREVVAWGALIAGHARQGDSEIVFDLVDKMRLEGIQPDGITILSVLTVCSHVGLVDKGTTYFEAMGSVYGISPTIEHYTCMVDLLGRAGQIDEALVVVKTMPFQPDCRIWLTLLNGCQKWSRVEVGRQAFEYAVKLDEKDAAAYVVMSNIYASAQMWEEAKEMQARRVKSGAWKEPGQSWWTDMNGAVHSFVVGDRRHPY